MEGYCCGLEESAVAVCVVAHPIKPQNKTFWCVLDTICLVCLGFLLKKQQPKNKIFFFSNISMFISRPPYARFSSDMGEPFEATNKELYL